MKKQKLYCVIGACFHVPVMAWAAGPIDEAKLPTVVVIGGQKKQDYDETLNNVQSLSRQELNKAVASDIQSSVRYVPGVSVAKDGTEKGVGQSFRIRGMDSNRITMTIDGDRLPEGQAWGHSSPYNSGRDNVEFDTLKRMDIIKGPSSAKNGSDVLGSAVNFRTYDPEDFVDADKPWYLGLKQGYNNANHERKTTLTTAGQLANWSAMFIGTKTKGHETQNMGDQDGYGKKRTKANPVDADGHNYLGKLVWADGEQRLALMAEQFENDVIVDRRHISSNEREKNDNISLIKRTRLAVDYQYIPEHSFVDEWSFRLYQNHLDNKDNTRTRMFASSPIVENHNDFKQKITGIRSETKVSFDTASIQHELRAGVDLRWTKTERLELSNREQEKQRKDFPDADAKNLGFFIQDTMNFGQGWQANVGLNFDHHSMKSKPDETFLNIGKEGSNGTNDIDDYYLRAQHYNANTITPKLSLSKDFGPQTQAYASYAMGVRHPSFENLGTYNHGGNQIVPNPDLKKEKAHHYELGLSHGVNRSHYAVTGFYSQYRDFMLSRNVTLEGQNYTMPMNVSQVKVYGIEGILKQHLVDDLFLNASFAWAKSKDKETGRELESEPFSKDRLGLDPLTIVLGLSYEKDRWGLAADWKRVNGKTRQYKDKPYFHNVDVPKYHVLDLTGWWQVNKHFSVNAGVYNVANQKYWQGIDLQGEKTQDMWLNMYRNKDFWTQPGRTYAISAQIKF